MFLCENRNIIAQCSILDTQTNYSIYYLQSFTCDLDFLRTLFFGVSFLTHLVIDMCFLQPSMRTLLVDNTSLSRRRLDLIKCIKFFQIIRPSDTKSLSLLIKYIHTLLDMMFLSLCASPMCVHV